MGLLAIVEDEPQARRLVLRAAPWSLLDRVRRGLATGVAFALCVGWLPVLFEDRRLFCGALFLGGVMLLLAYLVLQLPQPEVEEIVIDGGRGTFVVVVRGVNVWGRRTVRVDREVPVSVHGLSPAGPARHELGITLGTRSPTIPSFGIESVDRREEAEALVHTIAAHLDLRVETQSDEVRALSWKLGATGALPRPAMRVASLGYRDAPVAETLDVSKRRGFEAPSHAPRSLDEITGSELRGKLERRGVWVSLRPHKPWGWMIAWLLASGGCAWLGKEQGPDWTGAFVGASLPTVLWILGTLFFGALLVVAWPLRTLAWLLGRDSVRLPRSPSTEWSSGFSLEADHLRARVFGWPRNVYRGDDGSLFLVDRQRSTKEKGRPRTYRSWRELWVYSGRSWSLLARSRAVDRASAGPCSSLDTLAFTMGERLDLPVRTARG